MYGMSEYDADLAEARSLARMIVVIAERARASFSAAVEPYGLPVPAVRGLLLIGEPVPMRDMADHLACDPSYITGIADLLENRGLATRVPGKDRRVKMLQLTPEGVALRDQIVETVQTKAGFAHQLDASERRTLRQLLERLLDEGGQDDLLAK